MPFYAIFEVFHRRDPHDRHASGPTRGLAPVSVFSAPTADKACQAAARATRSLTSYVAIECTPWGIDMMEVEGTHELGEISPSALAELDAGEE